MYMISTVNTKLRMYFIFAWLLISAMAFAQNQPSAAPDKNKNEPQKEEQNKKNEAQSFAMQAARIISNAQHKTPAGYLAIPVNQKDWTTLLKDKDLGPFLKLKEPKPNLSVVVLILNPEESATFCVYFDDVSPIGMVALPPAPGGKIDAGEVAKAYKTVSKDMLKEGDEELLLSDGEVSSDDGQPLVAFNIASGGKSKKN